MIVIEILRVRITPKVFRRKLSGLLPGFREREQEGASFLQQSANLTGFPQESTNFMNPSQLIHTVAVFTFG